jgi:hypothetical protein
MLWDPKDRKDKKDREDKKDPEDRQCAKSRMKRRVKSSSKSQCLRRPRWRYRL